MLGKVKKTLRMDYWLRKKNFTYKCKDKLKKEFVFVDLFKLVKVL